MRAKILALDIKYFEKVNGLQSRRSVRWLLRLISFSGDGYFYASLALYLCWMDSADYGVALMAIMLAFGLDLPSFMLLKKLFRRPRPFDMLPDCQHTLKPSDQFSMPSGHAAAAALFAVQMAHFFPEYSSWSLLWALLVGFSRVSLGVHYPLDVVAGYFLGALCGTAGIHLAYYFG